MFKKFFALAVVSMAATSSFAFIVDVVDDGGNTVVIYGPPAGVGMDLDKIFVNLNPIVLRLTVTADDVAAGVVEISEGIVNDTDFDWNDFHMILEPLGPGLPVFAQSVAGNPFISFVGGAYGDPIPNVTTVAGPNLDILWDIPAGRGAYTGYFGPATEGRLAIDVRNMTVDQTFLLIEVPSIVPEPATMTAIGLGLIGVFARRRRK